MLADVLELGERSWELHESIGRFIVQEAETGRVLSALIIVGQEAQAIAQYVSSHTDMEVVICENNQEAAEAVKKRTNEGDWVLVKGSRGMKMDEVVKQLIKE